MSYDPNQQGAPPGYGPPHPEPGGYPAPAPGFQAPASGYPAPGYAAPGGYGPGGQPPSAVAWVIIGFIFFWPVGIAALLSSLKVSPAWYAGDHAGAQRYADQTKTRGKIALFLGIALTVLYVVLSAILLVTSDV